MSGGNAINRPWSQNDGKPPWVVKKRKKKTPWNETNWNGIVTKYGCTNVNNIHLGWGKKHKKRLAWEKN